MATSEGGTDAARSRAAAGEADVGVDLGVEVDVAQVLAARRGDRAAFARLHGRYASMVHGILVSRVAPSDADDLVQDVFVRALERLGSLAEPAAFGAWLASIARHRAVDHLRRRRKVEALPDDLAGESRMAAEAADDAQASRAALDAVRALPEAYRETLVLRLVEGMTGPEIAERTGLTPGSVRVNLHRGMKLLRKALASGTEKSDG